jgi:alkaline phosphatase
MLALDDAVRVALAYRERHSDMLIVVLADHETGGMSLMPTASGELELRYAWTDHTLELVPLFAVGPGAERFGGLHRNDEIGRLLLDAVAPDRGTATAPPAERD